VRRERRAARLVQAAVPAEPAGVQEQDVAGLELDVLPFERGAQVLGRDRIGGRVVERPPVALAEPSTSQRTARPTIPRRAQWCTPCCPSATPP
jgi:hypothetical protein